MEAPERFAHYPSFMLPTDNGAWSRWSDYATLAARLAEVERERDRFRAEVRRLTEGWQIQHNRAEAAEARAERLEAALRFYADERLDGYDVAVTDYGLSTEEGHIIRDGGEIARAALQQEGGATDTPPPAPSPDR
jgi:hypothetical protein